MRPIYLCGFMGCGKSHIGRMLAIEYCAVLIDLDRYIVQKENMTIPQIFEKYGEQHFRELEASYIKNFKGRTVVATGGGAILRDETASFARAAGRVVFLNASFERCYKRIEGDKNRPLVVNNTKEQLKELYDKRLPIYRRNSDVEINADTLDTDIVRAVKEYIDRT